MGSISSWRNSRGGSAPTVGGFHAHFPSKNDLVNEALRRTGAQLRDKLFAGIEEKPEDIRAEVILKRYLSAARAAMRRRSAVRSRGRRRRARPRAAAWQAHLSASDGLFAPADSS